MKILIIGGTGTAGRRIVHEALGRGHRVTLASRHGSSAPGLEGEAVTSVRLDAADHGAVRDAAQEHDLIVGATRPDMGREEDIIASTHGLAAGAGTAGTRLLVVGGASPLRVPGTGRLVLDDRRWVPREIRSIAAASNRQLEILREHTCTDWVYLAPSADFAPGRRKGGYLTLEEELVIAADGSSRISMEDYAIALIDLAETPGAPHRVLAVGAAVDTVRL